MITSFIVVIPHCISCYPRFYKPTPIVTKRINGSPKRLSPQWHVKFAEMILMFRHLAILAMSLSNYIFLGKTYLIQTCILYIQRKMAFKYTVDSCFLTNSVNQYCQILTFIIICFIWMDALLFGFFLNIKLSTSLKITVLFYTPANLLSSKIDDNWY